MIAHLGGCLHFDADAEQSPPPSAAFAAHRPRRQTPHRRLRRHLPHKGGGVPGALACLDTSAALRLGILGNRGIPLRGFFGISTASSTPHRRLRRHLPHKGGGVPGALCVSRYQCRLAPRDPRKSRNSVRGFFGISTAGADPPPPPSAAPPPQGGGVPGALACLDTSAALRSGSSEIAVFRSAGFSGCQPRAQTPHRRLRRHLPHKGGGVFRASAGVILKSPSI